MKEFYGKLEDWSKWKNRTECALAGSGYESILMDRAFADENPKMNWIVFSQLAVATVDGTAFHLVMQFDDIKDGHAAWSALLNWFDGDLIRNEMASTLRNYLSNYYLTSGVSADHYINKFQTWMQELDRIPGSNIPETTRHICF